MAATAIDEAKRFLYLHPWSTTGTDNPVQLLQAVVDEIDGGGADEEDDDEGMPPADDDEGDGFKVQKLLAFIRGLRDDLKISEAEYQLALQSAS